VNDLNREAPTCLAICTLCERQTSDALVPWCGERLCLVCTDLSLDLLALAIADLMTAAAETASPRQEQPASPDGTVLI
jgi:hypothetical protein